ncbi:branched-chain amino acid ABC transporter permease [Nocardioides hungaricus]
MQFLVTQLSNGVAAGLVYAMLAVGYSLVYGILAQINFAHGYIYMIGAFTTLSVAGTGAGLVIGILSGVLVGAIAAVVIERLAYRPVRENRLAPTVTAVGVGLVLENIARLIWGTQVRPMPFPWQDSTFQVFGLTFSPLQVVILLTGVAMAGGLWLLTTRTNLGRAMRAVRDDLPTAELMGMPVNRVVVGVYVLGAVLGVVGGILYGGYYGSISVAMGFAGTLNAFTATVIGGIGSIWGPFWGGLMLGVIQALVAGYVDSALLNTVTFALLIAFLLLRPSGLAGVTTANRL